MNDADIERLINEARSKGILQAKWVDDALPILPPTSCQCDWCADRRAGKQMVAAAPADDWPTFDFGAAIREGVLSGSDLTESTLAEAAKMIRRFRERILIPSRTHEQDTTAQLDFSTDNLIVKATERFAFADRDGKRFMWSDPMGRWEDDVVAMADAPQTITRAADDMSFIAKRAKEIEEDRIQSLRNRDPEVAGAEHLDRIADDYGEKRQGVESDYTFRQRLLKKVRGEA